MIRLEVAYRYPHRHLIDLVLHIPTNDAPTLRLQLPAWRPGRYELQNFARNIQQISATSETGKSLHLKRIARNTWEVATEGAKQVQLHYNYFAKQLDAGGSWLDERLLYINWINCTFYVEGRIDEPYQVQLQLPESYCISCGLEMPTPKCLQAADFYELVDAPMMASPHLQHRSYRVEGYSANFHIWFYGDCMPDWDKIIADFQKCTKVQLELFGDFPASDFHFQFIIAPWQIYHGVEHRNSTLIVLGPDADFEEQYFYDNMLAIASHELFHFWNVCRIRPQELMPYDLTREVYFPTGFIVEGITTFYGDWMLYKSGVWSFERYLEEVNAQLKKYAHNFGRKTMSLVEASYDLWTDGYSVGIPHRKVSIYNEGALAALLLHLWLLSTTQGKRSLDDVMRRLWQNYKTTGKGYTMEDYKKIVSEVAEQAMDDYFNRYIEATEDLAQAISQLAKAIHCQAETVPAPHAWERRFGMMLEKQAGHMLVTKIIPDSPADKVLAIKDKILSVNELVMQDLSEISLIMERFSTVQLTVNRDERIHRVVLKADGKQYFSYTKLRQRF
ncbi:MAG: M61 family peptidase [Cytophagales bacterium]|nr:M61 family peptidase [Bernardetiaceae bacterium]MDW8204065.1 M61 family peptidase [Cytophagales bacterium]